ncbi:MAG: crossover junction endodeoxyribonuclease RuvC [Parcubacteria group bacterium]|nr:crossover junction endodeoxyribonuclease RuvC [Parcubacteria group bacterium]
MRIMGIDPGTATTGYGIIDRADDDSLRFIACGVIKTPAHEAPATRLLSLTKDLTALVKKYHPSRVAVEKLFMTVNQKTAIAVAEARGVILVTCEAAGLPITEYTPLQVKNAVTGDGHAEKSGVGKMVTIILGLTQIPEPDDAADALAIALCDAAHVRSVALIADR